MARRAARVPEKAEQQHGVTTLRTIGSDVWVLGTKRRRGDHPGTMQTPGIADVYAVLPLLPGAVYRVALWWEAKAKGGRLGPDQQRFERAHALMAPGSVVHLVGTFDVLLRWLVARGYLKATGVPFYRLSGGAGLEGRA